MKEFFKKLDVVLIISGILAVVSMLWNPPGVEYLEFIDVRVLCLLFSLMAIVAGLSAEGMFVKLAELLIGRAGNLKILAYILVGLCYFLSMFITNDVALITFVPMTIFMLKNYEPKYLIRVIVFETIAANLGSMLLPFGNPHNLYLFGYYQMDIAVFMKTMLPAWLVSFLLLVVLIGIFIPAEQLQAVILQQIKGKTRNIVIYALLFVLAIGGVLRLIPYGVVLVVVIVVLLLLEPGILKKVDYGLLLTFAFFFIFVGNLSVLEPIRQGVQTFLDGRVVLAGALVSQIISNVPASLMLSGFTDEGTRLLLGVNIGGLGTLIASMASLISYKYYRGVEKARVKSYFLCFTGWNVMILFLLLFLFR